MAYFEGTAKNSTEMLSILAEHAQSVGWVTDKKTNNEWYGHNEDGFWSILVLNSNWHICGNTGFDAKQEWNKQPGNSVDNARVKYSGDEGSQLSLPATEFIRYYLFATAQYLHLHIEVAHAEYRSMQIGCLNKTGLNYNGGHYVSAVWLGDGSGRLAPDVSGNAYPFSYGYYNYTARIRFNLDLGQRVMWELFGGDYPAIGLGAGDSGGSHPSELLVHTSANSLNASTILVPCSIYVTGEQGRVHYIGEVPDFAVCRMDYLAAAEILTFGTERWLVLPAVKKGAAGDNKSSGLLGYAYKL